MDMKVLTGILKEVLETDDVEFGLESKLYDEIGLCSFDMMVIIGIIEDEYDKSVDLIELSKDMTIKGLINAIR
ncbi:MULTISPECIES: acyl carrier protein [unclassified Coprococcus]|uniref:acyl carrier protein n=1 Tax=unclassified Coprococcus TaxID=2684943 RepID=UPI000E5529B8|nr:MULTISPECIES: acyl carrier protein [unclassified Coprococcus]RGI33912.1 acyl carrier protein [Coprococcus sp. OM06-34AC]RGI41093.1 acyl carrier protein [Coprococcus sp. OM06-25]